MQQSDPLKDAAAATDKLREWTARRDEAVRRARAQGVPLRAIADAIGMTHQSVVNICNR